MNIKAQLIALIPLFIPVVIYFLFSLLAYCWGPRKITQEVTRVVQDPLEDFYEGLMEGKSYHQIVEEKNEV